MPIAVPYVRFSSIEQKDGDSRRRQRKSVTDWLARNPDFTEYDRKFEDLGVSGFDGGHSEKGELANLLAAIQEGFIPAGSVVLVEAMDRFSRLKPYATINLLHKIVEQGVAVITLDDSQRYDATSLENDALIYLAMKAKAAHDYSKRLSNQITESYDGRANAAKASIPIKRRNPFWLTSEGKLQEDGSVDAIRQVFAAFTNGVPLRALAIQYSQYFANRQSLKHALRNPAVIGHWQRTKTIEVDGKRRRVDGELIKNVFTPAVTEELYFQVQKLLDNLAELTPTVARKFPLAGLMQCGACGANMVLLRQNARQQTDAVRCYRRMQSSEKCTNQKTIPVPVVGWFYETTRKPHALRAYQRTKLPENQRQRIKLEGQIDQLKQQQARMRRLVMLDDGDKDALADYSKLVAEKKAREQELASLPQVADTPAVSMLEFHKFLNGDHFAISNLLQQDGYRIVCHNDGVLEVKASADDSPEEIVQYVGYARKHKMWEIKPKDAETLFVDRYGRVQFPQYVTITTSQQWQQHIKAADLSAYMDDEDLADYLGTVG